MEKKHRNIIVEPEGVTFVVENRPPSKKDQKMIKEWFTMHRKHNVAKKAKKAK